MAPDGPPPPGTLLARHVEAIAPAVGQAPARVEIPGVLELAVGGFAGRFLDDALELGPRDGRVCETVDLSVHARSGRAIFVKEEVGAAIVVELGEQSLDRVWIR